MRGFFALIARLIGFLLLLVAIAVLGHDLLAWRENGVFSPTSIGQLWHYVHRASLSAIQEAVQRYIAPELWDPGIITALRVLGGVGPGSAGNLSGLAASQGAALAPIRRPS